MLEHNMLENTQNLMCSKSVFFKHVAMQLQSNHPEHYI